jgi:DNA (cytosine-5)-methyltransferase 1
MTANIRTIGSLCSGIGGLELGLERSGLGTVVWQVEIDPFCRRVLAKHWPNATRYSDVRLVGGELEKVDGICIGFPCQNLSHHANVRTRTGLDGESSGLWRECGRVVELVRPRWVVVENISDAWREWVPSVRRDLGRLGYSSLPVRVRAADVGAPFEGARIFVIATANCHGEPTRPVDAQMARLRESADACRQDWGKPSSRALGVADGVPARMDRLRAVGNAVVPQCAELVGRHLVLQLEGESA